jgi:hypothetical protein
LVEPNQCSSHTAEISVSRLIAISSRCEPGQQVELLGLQHELVVPHGDPTARGVYDQIAHRRRQDRCRGRAAAPQMGP